jgi:hypothetical protein
MLVAASARQSRMALLKHLDQFHPVLGGIDLQLLPDPRGELLGAASGTGCASITRRGFRRGQVGWSLIRSRRRWQLATGRLGKLSHGSRVASTQLISCTLPLSALILFGMATGAESAEAIGEAMDTLVSTANRGARILRESKGDLWPQAAPGGGKNAAHVRARHLTALPLALGTNPITSAPGLVTGLRGLVPVISGQSSPFLPGADLGQVLDGHLDTITTPEGRAAVAINVQNLSVSVYRIGTRRPFVILEAWGRDEAERPLERLCWFEPPAHEMAEAVPYVPPSAPVTRFTLNSSLFEVLADLLADTKAREARTSNVSSLGLPLAGGTPGTKNAALAGAARTRNQDHDLAAPEGQGCSTLLDGLY